MRKLVKIVVPVLLLAAVVMIVAPRIWVKNKKSRLMYQGRTFENALLYHGSGGRLLIQAKLPGEAPFLVYDPARGVASCGDGAFLYVKLAFIETRTGSRCTWFRGAKEAKASATSVQFRSPRGIDVEMLWQPPPR